VLRRMLFPGNPERVRAAVAPPPKAAERDAPEKPAGTNRASAKGKVKRGGAVKPGKVHHVHSKAEFEKLVKGTRAKQLIVVDFAATWCGPCQQMAPKFESMAAAMPHAKFVHVDVDECKEVSQQYGVTAMPTFKFIRGGKEVDTMQGADENALREKVESLAGKPDRWASAGGGRTL